MRLPRLPTLFLSAYIIAERRADSILKKQLSNEELVEQIRSGRKVSENMETLYKNNLPLIRQFIRPFIYFEPEQDLLQQAYIGLWTATTHYESGENVRFMTYAQFWIQQDIRRYLENCGSIIRIPPHNRQKVIRYKKLIRDYERDHGREPTDQEAAACLGVSEDEIQKIRIYSQNVASLDAPLKNTDGEELSLADTIADRLNMEEDTVDRLHEEAMQTELWDIVSKYADQQQDKVIRLYFRDGKTLSEIAAETGVSLERVRQIKADGLRRLRRGKALRELEQKCEIAEADIFRGGFSRFKYTGLSSVEKIILRLDELEEQYKTGVM